MIGVSEWYCFAIFLTVRLKFVCAPVSPTETTEKTLRDATSFKIFIVVSCGQLAVGDGGYGRG